jgi:hypothetical protein
MDTEQKKSFFQRFAAPPYWVQWVPAVTIVLLATTIGALIDAKDLRAQLAQAKNAQPQPSKPYAYGRISYEDARAFYGLLKHPVEVGGLFHQKTYAERVAYANDARALRDKVEPIFGVPSQCYSAAVMRAEYARAMSAFATGQELRSGSTWIEIAAAMHAAFTYGESVAGCYDDIEALQ